MSQSPRWLDAPNGRKTHVITSCPKFTAISASSTQFFRKYQPISGHCDASAVTVAAVSTFRIREAADLLGVSDDTLRRWADSDRLTITTDHGGRKVIEGTVLAQFAQELAASIERPEPQPVVSKSARNRFVGLVTRVIRDTVMAQVEIQAGPHRIVSLMRREAADELKLEPGVLAIAAVRATKVVIEIHVHP